MEPFGRQTKTRKVLETLGQSYGAGRHLDDFRSTMCVQRLRPAEVVCERLTVTAVTQQVVVRAHTCQIDFTAQFAALASDMEGHALIPSKRAAVPPRIAIRSSSLRSGVLSTRSTSVLVQGKG